MTLGIVGVVFAESLVLVSGKAQGWSFYLPVWQVIFEIAARLIFAGLAGIAIGTVCAAVIAPFLWRFEALREILVERATQVAVVLVVFLGSRLALGTLITWSYQTFSHRAIFDTAILAAFYMAFAAALCLPRAPPSHHSGCSASSSASRACKRTRSPGSRSSYTASRTSACRNRYATAVALGDQHVVLGRVAQAVGRRRRPACRRARRRAGDRRRGPIDRGDPQARRCASSESESMRASTMSRERPGQRRDRPSGGEELLGEERVALGAVEVHVDQFAVRVRARGSTRSCSRSSSRSKRARSSARTRRSGRARRARPQRMTAMEVVGTVGADEHDARVCAGCERGTRRSRGRVVGPVQIFEHEQRRHAVAEALEHAEQVFEQRGRVLPVVVAGGGLRARARAARRLRRAGPITASERRGVERSCAARAAPARPARTARPGW